MITKIAPKLAEYAKDRRAASKPQPTLNMVTPESEANAVKPLAAYRE
jgi:hypothetical protein